MSKKTLSSSEGLVFQFFKCIEKKEMEGLLNLFDNDAIVYEPFSRVEGLHGISAIEPFLRVAMMANSNMRRKIELERHSSDASRVTALVTFERGDRARGRFTFEFDPKDPARQKIKSLHIEFLG